MMYFRGHVPLIVIGFIIVHRHRLIESEAPVSDYDNTFYASETEFFVNQCNQVNSHRDLVKGVIIEHYAQLIGKLHPLFLTPSFFIYMSICTDINKRRGYG